jgi:serine/threonine protein phosphatase 1
MTKLTFAIGDVHGCSKTLKGLYLACRQYAKSRHDNKPTFVFLGDYVDRGPNSKGVIKFLRGLQDNLPNIVCLCGNHDDMMSNCVTNDRHSDAGTWAMNGMIETIASYGEQATRSFNAAQLVMHDDAAWLAGLPTWHADRLRYYVHAGVKPKVALADQIDFHRLWIRKEFLVYEGSHEKLVVHGHTPVELADVRANRVNVDTGCVYGGHLSAAVFDDHQIGPLEILTHLNIDQLKPRER